MCASESHWQLSRPTIRERSKFLFNSDLLSDVTFRVSRQLGVSNSKSDGKMLIPAHKLLLSLSSPVFFAMFYGELAETENIVDLSDCDYESVLELFRFMYSDEINLTGSNALQVLYLAKKYMVPSLAGKCVDYLQNNLDASNVFSILPNAQKLEEKRLLERCWEVIDGQTAEVVLSDEFVALERPLVKSVVQRNSLNVKEVDLFKAVDLWATKEVERQGLVADGHTKRRLLGDDILNAVRFPLMTLREFAAVVPDSGLLTANEMGDMIKHFSEVPTSSLQFERAPRMGRLFTEKPKRGRFGRVLPSSQNVPKLNYSRGFHFPMAAAIRTAEMEGDAC